MAKPQRMNHLLKSPFVVHPKTGRVCVPIDPDSVNGFDPAQVPTIGKLVEELLPVSIVNTSGNTGWGWGRDFLDGLVAIQSSL